MHNIDNNQLLTFWEFLNMYKIEIPIIQRDYAQGRIENETVRLTFLDALYQCIKNHKAISLDFIYGNILKKDTFQPLDGQQRLTTLFLLYLYAYKKDNINDHAINKIFEKFTYTTRISAEDFCKELSIKNIEIDANSDNVSPTIKDSNWYYLSWENDPTIRAMLIMLDAIHSKFKDIPNLFNILINDRLITFYFLILEDFGLSDDLYIKMNARGKVLTPFENLKAEIQNKAKENNWESNVAELDKFAYKIDGKWNDLMWESYKDDNNSGDDAHMRLISTIVMINVALNGNFDSNLKGLVVQKVNSEYKYRDLIKYIDKKTFDYINKTYAIYANIQESSNNIEFNFKLWEHKPKIAFFDELVYDCAFSTENINSVYLGSINSSYTCKVLFFAQTEYFMRNTEFNYDKFQDWMRVVRNIVSRGDIDCKKDNVKRTTLVRSPEAFISSINLINELAEGSSDIYKFLSEHEIKSSYVKKQINEEKIKARIIKKDISKKQLLLELENIEILKGRILFALKCADYDNIDIDSINWDKLENVKLVLEKYFNDKENILSNKLRRALLTIEVDGQYSFFDYYKGSTQILSDAPNKRSLIRKFEEIEYLINDEEYCKYFIKLVLLLTYKTFDEIFEDFYNNTTNEQLDNIPDWQVKLIIEPEHLDNCTSYYISVSDDKKVCYLLPSKQPRDISKCKLL